MKPIHTKSVEEISNERKIGLYSVLGLGVNEYQEFAINVTEDQVVNGWWKLENPGELYIQKQVDDYSESPIPIKEFIRKLKISQL